jgi:acylphosphatase
MLKFFTAQMLFRVHVIASGRVQGVAYRYYAEREALELAVTGWVKNLFDGRVEVVAEGEKTILEQFIERLRQGPRLARVDRLEVSWEDHRGEFSDFRISFSSF